MFSLGRFPEVEQKQKTEKKKREKKKDRKLVITRLGASVKSLDFD